MKREEEISNESLEYMMTSCIHDEIYDVDVRNAFEEGAKWADKHPDLSSLWHDATNEPEEGRFIVCVDDDNDCHAGAYYVDRVDALNRVYKSAVWNYGTLICYWDDVKIWAYAKDLLPKGGDSWK